MCTQLNGRFTCCYYESDDHYLLDPDSRNALASFAGQLYLPPSPTMARTYTPASSAHPSSLSDHSRCRSTSVACASLSSPSPLLLVALNLRTFFPETDTFFRTLVQSLQAVLWEADPQTFRFLYVSPQAESLLGYPVTHWMEQPDFWIAHIHPEDRDQAVAYCRKATDQCENHDFTYRMIRSDGKIVWVRDIVTVVPDEQGRPHRLRGLLLDVTEEHETRRQLEQVQQRYEDLFTNNPIATGVYSNNQIVYANPALAQLFGADQPEALLGQSVADLISPDHLSAARENIRRIVAQHEPIRQGRSRIRRLDGRPVMVDFSAIPIS